MIVESVEMIFAYLFARALWNFTLKRAEACKESPLLWLLKVTAMLGALAVIGSGFVLCILYLISVGRL